MVCTIQCQGVTFEDIDWVLFDKDGTLAQSSAFLYQLGRLRSRFLDAQIPGVQDPLLMAFGFEDNQLSPQGLIAVGSRAENEVAAAAYVAETGRGWVESLEIVHNAFAEADANLGPKQEATVPIDGVKDLVRSLTQSNTHLGIVSSDITQNVVAFAQHYGIADHFEILAGVDTVDKRDRAACQAFLQTTLPNIKPLDSSRIIVIGDSLADIQLAQYIDAVGCIGVTWAWNTPYAIPGAGAIASTPSDITILA
ncbi:MAG: HAD family hydrolase [Merismopedia sp. SIO2A8]|nr:HAD family hydrolase [Merismopedia sp. SIO2A8]